MFVYANVYVCVHACLCVYTHTYMHSGIHYLILCKIPKANHPKWKILLGSSKALYRHLPDSDVNFWMARNYFLADCQNTKL